MWPLPWQRVPRRPGRRRNCGRHAPSHGALLNGHTAGVIEFVRYVALGWPGGPNPSPRAQGWAERVLPLVEEPPSWLGRCRAASRRRRAARHLSIRHWVCPYNCLVRCAGQSARLRSKRMRRAEPARRRSGPTLLTPIAHAARQSHLSPITHRRGALGGVGGASGRDLCTSPYQPPLTAPGGETPTALVRR